MKNSDRFVIKCENRKIFSETNQALEFPFLHILFLQSVLPPTMAEIQRLRCRVSFQALQFRPEIQMLGHRMVNKYECLQCKLIDVNVHYYYILLPCYLKVFIIIYFFGGGGVFKNYNLVSVIQYNKMKM